MNTTRKHPRTLAEAFGPHTSRSLYVQPEPMHRDDKIVLAGCAAAAVFLIFFMVLS